jgi:large subunit ribosomal protein L32
VAPGARAPEHARRGGLVAAGGEQHVVPAHERERPVLEQQQPCGRIGLERDGEVAAVARAADGAPDGVGDRYPVEPGVHDAVGAGDAGAVDDAGGRHARAQLEPEARVAAHRRGALAREDEVPARGPAIVPGALQQGPADPAALHVLDDGEEREPPHALAQERQREPGDAAGVLGHPGPARIGPLEMRYPGDPRADPRGGRRMPGGGEDAARGGLRGHEVAGRHGADVDLLGQARQSSMASMHYPSRSPMAVPKQKQSHSRTHKRRAQHKISAPTYNACPQCHSPRLPHRVCPVCGTYAGREIVHVHTHDHDHEH